MIDILGWPEAARMMRFGVLSIYVGASLDVSNDAQRFLHVHGGWRFFLGLAMFLTVLVLNLVGFDFAPNWV